MTLKTKFLAIGLILIATNCHQNKEKKHDMKYTSAITFLYYQDFSYGIDFIESVLRLDLVMDQEFARVYAVNEKAFLGIVQKRDKDTVSGNTLFSLTTSNVESEYKRVKLLDVQNFTDIKYFESIPLKSFFFDDNEGHRFEIQQFLNEEDVTKF